MRKIYGFFTIAIVIYMGICGVSNLILINLYEDDYGREYRVEINRLKSQILAIEKNIENYSSSEDALNQCVEEINTNNNYEHIIKVRAYNRHDFLTNFDENIRDINNDYIIYNSKVSTYIIEYSSHVQNNNPQLIVLNAIFLVILCCIIIIFWVLVKKIFLPFRKISELPYELAKGNLTIPLRETKSKMFGKFIWALDVLRDTMEEQKKHELMLQKEKKTLLLSLSHDIKTPLSAIKLYAKALSKDLYTDKCKKEQVINSISDKVTEIEGYIADIVRAASEDFLEFQVSNKEFYIKEVITNINNYYKDKLALNNIDFSIISNHNFLIYGDIERAEEVIQNVMENAIKYGDGNKIWLETTENNDAFIVMVGNTGCTLDVNELPHIFDSFWRGSNISDNPGSGLGLYICRQLMHLMDGEILAKIDENRNIYIYIIFTKC